ncbi:hypothetical protein T552_01468 [Pneumocystis carinii B80]|uniref:Uncharacterized protein n=1 Tax=Pneumocystis carinii (strain B80) TaxID=1408658 RepID=A0A0W4ZKE4_PNEC8|nr:hypothetical protein T552_01468 [Pneumocystis carinii B80]KTW28839.1 hypothetical protein T552_01468 [Pneumocystis carinii B80]
MMGFVVVHIGAGCHSKSHENQYKRLCRRVCEEGIKLIYQGGKAIEVVEKTVQLLETNKYTNAGYGSNLTLNGDVECDASIMDGFSGKIAAVGALKKIKHPISVAKALIDAQDEVLSLNRSQPIILVGEGATLWATQNGIPEVEPETLISRKSRISWEKWTKELELCKTLDINLVSDTVGVIVVDKDGILAAGSSSGGIAMKYPGRLGLAAIPLAGTWVEMNENGTGVAVICSGSGEQIIATSLAKKCCERILMGKDLLKSVKNCIKKDFLSSRIIQGHTPFAGLVAVKVELLQNTYMIDFLFAHSTPSMGVGYMFSNDTKSKAEISENEKSPNSFVYSGNSKSFV